MKCIFFFKWSSRALSCQVWNPSLGPLRRKEGLFNFVCFVLFLVKANMCHRMCMIRGTNRLQKASTCLIVQYVNLVLDTKQNSKSENADRQNWYILIIIFLLESIIALKNAYPQEVIRCGSFFWVTIAFLCFFSYFSLSFCRCKTKQIMTVRCSIIYCVPYFL